MSSVTSRTSKIVCVAVRPFCCLSLLLLLLLMLLLMGSYRLPAVTVASKQDSHYRLCIDFTDAPLFANSGAADLPNNTVMND